MFIQANIDMFIFFSLQFPRQVRYPLKLAINRLLQTEQREENVQFLTKFQEDLNCYN